MAPVWHPSETDATIPGKPIQAAIHPSHSDLGVEGYGSAGTHGTNGTGTAGAPATRSFRLSASSTWVKSFSLSQAAGSSASRTLSSSQRASGSSASLRNTRRKRTPAKVAAGHASRGNGGVLQEEDENGKPQYILKTLDETEVFVYSLLENDYAEDPIHHFVPKFEGVVEDCDSDGKVSRYIRISNLLLNFWQPKVMDVKLGCRTFLESECDNPKPRPDLFERMEQLYPSQITEDEKKLGAITKFRWMTTRDNNSTIGTLGYRIDGVAGYRRTPKADLDLELAAIRAEDDTCAAFRTFAEACCTDDGEIDHGFSPLFTAMKLHEQLRDMFEALKASSFLHSREFIGSSVLLVADAEGNAGVFWIDFAKTFRLPDSVALTHRLPWVQGNHEDGLLAGFENLLNAWGKVVDALQAEAGGGKTPPTSQQVARLSTRSSTVDAGLWMRFLRAVHISPEPPRPQQEIPDEILLGSLPVFAYTIQDKSKLSMALQAAVAAKQVAKISLGAAATVAFTRGRDGSQARISDVRGSDLTHEEAATMAEDEAASGTLGRSGLGCCLPCRRIGTEARAPRDAPRDVPTAPTAAPDAPRAPSAEAIDAREATITADKRQVSDRETCDI
mmetsp:Transcript_23558/g.52173  ORF Transcript_23558/g.52173 Transcript_23558/m.52173 type:complete len:616 (+) Transcript_23558:107-1954(+)